VLVKRHEQGFSARIYPGAGLSPAFYAQAIYFQPCRAWKVEGPVAKLPTWSGCHGLVVDPDNQTKRRAG